MGTRYVSSEGASGPELFARAAGVPADPCVLDGVECQHLADGGQAYVGVFEAADVQGRYSGLWLGRSCLRGAWAVEFGADGLERAIAGPVEVSWGWSGVTPEAALLVQWRLELGRVRTDQGHHVVNELAQRSLYALVLDALDVNVFLAQIATRDGEVLVQGVFELRRLRRYVATVGEVCAWQNSRGEGSTRPIPSPTLGLIWQWANAALGGGSARCGSPAANPMISAKRIARRGTPSAWSFSKAGQRDPSELGQRLALN